MATTFTPVLTSSKSDEWYTPAPLFEELNKRFGPFTLDACASSGSEKCENFYGLDHPDTARRDALRRDWARDAHGGAVWVNPPYSRYLFPEFLRKAAEAADAGTRVVLLFPSNKTSNVAFHEYLVPRLEAGTASVRFLAGRVKFERPGLPATPAPHASMVVILEGKARS